MHIILCFAFIDKSIIFLYNMFIDFFICFINSLPLLEITFILHFPFLLFFITYKIF